MNYQDLMKIMSQYDLGAVLITKASDIVEINEKGKELLPSNGDIIGKKLENLAPNLLHNSFSSSHKTLPVGTYLRRRPSPTNCQLPNNLEMIVFEDASKEILCNMMYEIINKFEDAVIVCDDKKRILMLNDAAMKMDSILTADVLGKDIRDVYLPEEGKQLLLPQVIDEKKPIFDVRQQYTTLYGKVVDIIANTYPIMHQSYVLGGFSIMKDWSTIDQLNKQIIDLREKLTKEKSSTSISKKNTLSAKYHFNDIIYTSPQMKMIIEQCKQIAQNDSSVMFYGETGTGKELFAQSIHNASRRANSPFLAINCAAIPENLLESLLFGTEKGAYTGAERRPGLFEQANGGTLLLDEINSMNIHLQSKLLRVLQEGVIRRVGGSTEIYVDVRVLSNINIPPHQAILENKLRQDLFYRLGVVNIMIPPLRERKEDIPLLAKHYIMEYNKKMSCNVSDISKETAEQFRAYDWPGNVRELQHAIEHAMNIIPYDHQEITPEYLPRNMTLSMPPSVTIPKVNSSKLYDSIQEYEKQSILDALSAHNGNISAAARSLNISRQNLQYRMKRYQIQRQTVLQKKNFPF